MISRLDIMSYQHKTVDRKQHISSRTLDNEIIRGSISFKKLFNRLALQLHHLHFSFDFENLLTIKFNLHSNFFNWKMVHTCKISFICMMRTKINFNINYKTLLVYLFLFNEHQNKHNCSNYLYILKKNMIIHFSLLLDSNGNK